MLRRRRNAGFTTVELLVAMAVLALLLAIGAPLMQGVVVNMRILTASQTWTNGLALARAEAIRQNTLVTFTVTPQGWSVQRLDNGIALHQGVGSEGSTSLTVTPTPAGATTVTFDSLGRMVNPNPGDGSEDISQLDFTVPARSGWAGYTPMRIEVLTSGLSRLCNPASPATSASACL